MTAIKDKPIIFSGPMVRALLDGRKTQHRVPLKPQPVKVDSGGPWWKNPNQMCLQREPSLTYQIGQRLWVREAWLDTGEYYGGVHFRADHTSADLGILRFPWKSSTQMPRWASRLTLTVTDVRVQRVQEISEADALAEGIYRTDPTPEDIAQGCTDQDFVFQAPGVPSGLGQKLQRNNDQWWPNAPGAFALLWNHIHGFAAWQHNDWVCAISFDVSLRNIDSAEVV